MHKFIAFENYLKIILKLFKTTLLIVFINLKYNLKGYSFEILSLCTLLFS